MKSNYENYTFNISEFNAGVILINNGIQITLSKSLKKFFDKYGKIGIKKNLGGKKNVKRL